MLSAMAVSKMVMASSLTHFRLLTCAATDSSASYPTRLVPQPPDMIKWVRRQGGFVHHSLKIAQDSTNGLGLLASDEIPKGSDLIALPHHIPLRFSPLESDGGDEPHFVLVNLARQVPGRSNSFAFVSLVD